MTSYRFCRPDDIPLLVGAVEACWRVHAPGEPPVTVEGFRREMKELDVWPSNSMVALDTAGDPIAVLVGTKRPEAVLVHRLGVRPDHRRQGHGLHLLTSLSQKLAVLGPDRLLAEVPAERPDLLAFFAAAGYRADVALADWWREAPEAGAGPAAPEGLVTEVSVAELDATGVLADPEPCAWCRSRSSLLGAGERLRAAALAPGERVEAWAVWEEPAPGDPEPNAAAAPDGAPPPARVLRAGTAAEQGALLFPLLMSWLARRTGSALLLPRLAEGEVPARDLAAAGFGRGGGFERMAATARPL